MVRIRKRGLSKSWKRGPNHPIKTIIDHELPLCQQLVWHTHRFFTALISMVADRLQNPTQRTLHQLVIALHSESARSRPLPTSPTHTQLVDMLNYKLRSCQTMWRQCYQIQASPDKQASIPLVEQLKSRLPSTMAPVLKDLGKLTYISTIIFEQVNSELSTFNRHMWYNLRRWQLQALTAQLAQCPLPHDKNVSLSKRARDVQLVINGRKHKKDQFTSQENDIILQHQSIFRLGLPEPGKRIKWTDKYLKNRPAQCLVYLQFLRQIHIHRAQQNEANFSSQADRKGIGFFVKVRPFTLVPQLARRRRYFHISTGVLTAWLKRHKLWKQVDDQASAEVSTIFEVVFRSHYPRSRGVAYSLTSVKTDGVFASFTYGKPNLKFAKSTPNNSHANRSMEVEIDIPLTDSPSASASSSTAAVEKKQAKNKSLKDVMNMPGLYYQHELDTNMNNQDFKNRTLVGIDPGRNVLLTCEAYKCDGQDWKKADISWKLTKGRWYAMNKFHIYSQRERSVRQRREKRMNDAEKKLLDETMAMSLRHAKDSDATFQVLERRASSSQDVRSWDQLQHDIHFQGRAMMTFRRQRFQQHQKAQLELVQLLQDRFGSDAILAFGNGQFPTSSKGERSGPCIGLRNLLSQHFPVIVTDEYGTSKTCHQCENVVQPMAIMRVKKQRLYVNRQQDLARRLEDLQQKHSGLYLKYEDRPQHLQKYNDRVQMAEQKSLVRIVEKPSFGKPYILHWCEEKTHGVRGCPSCMTRARAVSVSHPPFSHPYTHYIMDRDVNAAHNIAMALLKVLHNQELPASMQRKKNCDLHSISA